MRLPDSSRFPFAEPIFQLVRVRLADAEPACLDTVFLPQQACPTLADHDFSSASLFQVLAREYGVILSRASGWLQPLMASDEEAALLGIPPGTLMLLLETIISKQDGTPVIFSRELWRGDRVNYLLGAAPAPAGQRRLG